MNPPIFFFHTIENTSFRNKVRTAYFGISRYSPLPSHTHYPIQRNQPSRRRSVGLQSNIFPFCRIYPGSGQLGIGVFPGFGKLRPGIPGLGNFTLTFKAFGQAIQGKAIPWLVGKVFPVNLFSLHSIADLQQQCAQ